MVVRPHMFVALNQGRQVCVVEPDSVTTEFAEDRWKTTGVDKFV